MTDHSARFRYDETLHEYFDLASGKTVPHITGLLERGGHIDSRWYTEESSDRGTQVHDLTAQFDLGALDVENLVSPFRSYVLAHVDAMRVTRPAWRDIEIPRVHPILKFGGRVDRAGVLFRSRCVCEVKTTAAPDEAHEIQTALQAILTAPSLDLPAEHVARFCLYLKDTGRYKLLLHEDAGNFRRAYELIRRYC